MLQHPSQLFLFFLKKMFNLHLGTYFKWGGRSYQGIAENLFMKTTLRPLSGSLLKVADDKPLFLA